MLASLLWLTVPLGLRELLDAVFEAGNRSLLNTIALALLGIFLLQAVFGFTGSYILEWIGERMVTDLRKTLYAQLHRLGLTFFSNQRLGEITSRLTNDVGSVRSAATSSLSEALTQSISLMGSLGLMVALNWRLSAVIFVTVPFVTIATRYFGEKKSNASPGRYKIAWPIQPPSLKNRFRLSVWSNPLPANPLKRADIRIQPKSFLKQPEKTCPAQQYLLEQYRFFLPAADGYDILVWRNRSTGGPTNHR